MKWMTMIPGIKPIFRGLHSFVKENLLRSLKIFWNFSSEEDVGEEEGEGNADGEDESKSQAYLPGTVQVCPLTQFHSVWLS